jgi:hypothetical protein
VVDHITSDTSTGASNGTRHWTAGLKPCRLRPEHVQMHFATRPTSHDPAPIAEWLRAGKRASAASAGERPFTRSVAVRDQCVGTPSAQDGRNARMKRRGSKPVIAALLLQSVAMRTPRDYNVKRHRWRRNILCIQDFQRQSNAAATQQNGSGTSLRAQSLRFCKSPSNNHLRRLVSSRPFAIEKRQAHGLVLRMTSMERQEQRIRQAHAQLLLSPALPRPDSKSNGPRRRPEEASLLRRSHGRRMGAGAASTSRCPRPSLSPRGRRDRDL